MARRGGRRASETLWILSDPLTRLCGLSGCVMLTRCDALRELREIADRHARGRRTKTAIPRLSIRRREAPTPPLPSLCGPRALFVLRGGKSVLIGDRTLRYDPASYFVYAVETPATGHVIDASAERPYLATGFTLDIQAIAASTGKGGHRVRGRQCLAAISHHRARLIGAP